MPSYLTPEGLEKLKKELDYLENTKRKEVAERLRHSAAFGDLKENAAYDEAKDAQGFLEGRISALKETIAKAKVVDRKNTPEVQIGSSVVLKNGSQKEEFQIVDPQEADITKGKISYLSPLGSQLLGKNKGEKVNVATPGGKIDYEILEVC